MEHRLIVTADDFGACDFIDNGIKKAIREGVVSSIAAFVNFEPRDASHPYGAYKGSIRAIKDLMFEISHSDEFAQNRDVRIGLHFNFHAGSPAYPFEDKIESLLLPDTVNGRRLFRNIEKFNPNRVDPKEFAKELHAQYSRFFNELGFAPDHFSSHFPIIFMTPELFKMVCELASPLNIPVRNPFLVWQTKNESKDSANHEALSFAKKFFRKKTKTKEIELKRAIKLVDTLDNTILNGWKQKNIKSLQEAGLPFPDFTQCHLYGNGSDESAVDNIIEYLLDFHPQYYKKREDLPVVTEVITHVGEGSFQPEQVPHGIDPSYFSGRLEELERITGSLVLKERKLFNFKSAFE